MTDDLVKRLRDFTCDCFSGNSKHMTWEAAARIERLEAALEKIAQHDMQAIALDALRPGERIRGKTND
jgi:hypothetical protein